MDESVCALRVCYVFRTEYVCVCLLDGSQSSSVKGPECVYVRSRVSL